MCRRSGRVHVTGTLINAATVLAGATAGTLLGDRLKARFGRGQSRFTEGFVVASLVFCVGPLTILSCIQDGLKGDYSLLAVKALLDGFAALAFASALGWGVGFSVLVILVYQGALSILAGRVAGVFDPARIAAMTAVGGVMILAIGLRLLDLKRLRVASLLPALVPAPVTVAAVQALRWANQARVLFVTLRGILFERTEPSTCDDCRKTLSPNVFGAVDRPVGPGGVSDPVPG